jgi:hypothetical protein
MRITIANISSTISQHDLNAAVAAISNQVCHDFGPEWGVQAILRSTVLNLHNKKRAPISAIQDAVIYVGDESKDPTTGVKGALGYHSDNHANIPYGFIYLDVCAKYKENWTCTLSHEVLELLADPSAALTVTGPAPKGMARNVYYDLEVCDPTQGDTYDINGITVSNFVTKAYFGMFGGQTNQTNFMNLKLAPLGLRPGGYLQYEDSSGSHQIYGQKVTAEMQASKKVMSMRRRTFRRKLNRTKR